MKKIIVSNLLVFLTLILFIEIIFGYWFDKNNFGILMKKQSSKYLISALKKLSLTTELKLNEMKFNSIKKINNNFVWSLVLKKLVKEIKLKIN